jgi:hypothetical protein
VPDHPVGPAYHDSSLWLSACLILIAVLVFFIILVVGFSLSGSACQTQHCRIFSSNSFSWKHSCSTWSTLIQGVPLQVRGPTAMERLIIVAKPADSSSQVIWKVE